MAFAPPTDEEKRAVKHLREVLDAEDPPAGHYFTDTALLRFHRGRKAVFEDVKRSLLRHVKWRKENDVEHITEHIHKFKQELDSGKMLVEGYDKEGRPCIFIHAHKHDKNNRDLEQLRLLIIYTMETILKRANPDEERILICFDLTGFRLSCMDYDLVKLLISTLEFNYPDTLSSSLIINSPFFFYACWAVIRPWLDPVTAAKVGFVDSDHLQNLITTSPPPRRVTAGSTTTTHSAGDNENNSTKVITSIDEISPEEFDSLFNQLHDPNAPKASTSSPQATTHKKKKRFWFF